MRTFRNHHFEGCGQYLAVMSTPIRLSVNVGGKARPTTELYKVAYNNHCENGKSSVFLVAMSDGMTLLSFISYGDTHDAALKDLCNKLNTTDHNEFRFATMDEVINTVKVQTSRVADGKILELSSLCK